MSTPFFSVVVPHYRDPRVVRAVQSLTQQTLQATEYEIIVVDDGSPLSAETRRSLARCPGVAIIEQPHLGVGSARNSGVRGATGQWIVFMDSDCTAEPDLLAHYYNFLQLYPTAVAVGGQTLPMQTPRGLVAEYCSYRNHLRYPIRAVDGTVGSIITANACFRKDLLTQVGGFSTELDDLQRSVGGEDCDLSYKIRKAGKRLDYCAGAKVWHEHRSSLRSFVAQQVRNARGLALHASLHQRSMSDVGLPDLNAFACLKHCLHFLLVSAVGCPSLAQRARTYWGDSSLRLRHKIAFPLCDALRRSCHYVGLFAAKKMLKTKRLSSFACNEQNSTNY